MVLWLNLAAVPLLIGSLMLFATLASALRPGVLDVEVTSGPGGAVGLVLPILAIVVTAVGVLLFHEGVHGIAAWLITRSAPSFRFRVLSFSVSASGWYFTRNSFVAVGLAPLVVITILGFGLVLLLPPLGAGLALFAVALNTAGTVGDGYLCARLLRLPSTTLIEVHPDRCVFHVPAAG